MYGKILNPVGLQKSTKNLQKSNKSIIRDPTPKNSSKVIPKKTNLSGNSLRVAPKAGYGMGDTLKKIGKANTNLHSHGNANKEGMRSIRTSVSGVGRKAEENAGKKKEAPVSLGALTRGLGSMSYSGTTKYF